MDFERSEEQDSFAKVVRDFAEHEIAPCAEAWDRDGTFPTDVGAGDGARLGLFGLPFPQEYGGFRRRLHDAVPRARMEIARVDSSMAITLEAGVGLGAAPIARFGTGRAAGPVAPGAMRWSRPRRVRATEPDAGSGAGAMRTRATLDGDEWVIDGAKAFITNSGTPMTSLITVAACTGRDEISSVVVPAATAGLEVGPPYRKMGWHASDTHPLTLIGCRVPAGHLLGAAARGCASSSRSSTTAASRSPRSPSASPRPVSSTACGTRGSAWRSGKPIGANQGIAFRCADVAVIRV